MEVTESVTFIDLRDFFARGLELPAVAGGPRTAVDGLEHYPC